MIKAVGLTGGIGAGKSTVARVFSVLGVPVFSSDEAGRAVLGETETLEWITDRWPEVGIVAPDGTPDRAALARWVFGDPQKLTELNAYIHPRVRRKFQTWMEQQQVPYVLNEAAILFETGSYRQFDANCLVTAPEDLRVERVMQRDGVEKDAILQRMRHQWPEEKKQALADFEIVNDGNQSVIRQVLAIHQVLLSH